MKFIFFLTHVSDLMIFLVIYEFFLFFAVNGEYITACNHDDAVNILRNAGDLVVLTVKHYRAAKPFLQKAGKYKPPRNFVPKVLRGERTLPFFDDNDICRRIERSCLRWTSWEKFSRDFGTTLILGLLKIITRNCVVFLWENLSIILEFTIWRIRNVNDMIYSSGIYQFFH